jgi:electron transfer flavoprotein alpha subunit
MTMNKKNILVVIEQTDNKIAEVSLELICKACELAKQLNVAVDAVAIGFNLQNELEKLGGYGCETVYYVEDKRLTHFTSVPYAKNIVNIINKYQPQIVLFGASVNGRDVSPRVASALRCGLTADCTELQIGTYEFRGQAWENTLLQIRPAFGGNIIATIASPESTPSMATVREGVMKMIPPDHSKRAKIINEKCELTDADFLTEILEIVRAQRSVNLKAASIIVAAGMGVANQQSLNLVRDLAKTIGAEVGCTRPVIDAGLLPWEHQIGQTGTTVRPNLYIACGISGQIQHTAGMDEAKRIIAINSDPTAPIFKVAHYGIVGDLNSVIPKMIKAYKNKA